MKRGEFLQALGLVAEIVENMSDEDFRALKQGKLSWVSESRTKKRKKAGEEIPDFTGVIEVLHQFDSEAEALEYLKAAPEVKTNRLLLQMGRALGAPVKTRMKKIILQETIVRYCVGRRLQSEVISRVTGQR